MTYDPASRPLPAISEETLISHVQARSVREVVVQIVERTPDGKPLRWSLSVRLGDPYGRLTPLRSRREEVRTWASVDTLVLFCQRLGLRGAHLEF